MIQVRDLSKDYGPVRALDAVSFDVGDSQVLGFLGPNGAGKSTAMKIITSYIAPSGGSVSVDGIDVAKDPIEVRRRIGYLPETNPLYADMQVDDYLQFCGKARGLSGPPLRQRLDYVADACGLTKMWKKSIFELSKGFKQRTGLAQALIHDPKILVLDEPTSGLDPLQIIEIRRLIQELAKTKTIIFSTHILQEVSSTTDRVIIINGGRIIADGFISELQREAAGGGELRVAVAGPRAEVERELGQLAGTPAQVVGEEGGVVRVRLQMPAGRDLRPEVGALCARQGWAVHELTVPGVSLEQTFIELVRQNRGEAATATGVGQ